mmetsp:Transcript_5580/g.11053  ORF Transcript_5580/g.11053 Transcript_5580/m.11053 type:complete len:88 (-) Transcript_5580:253-516(-)
MDSIIHIYMHALTDVHMHNMRTKNTHRMYLFDLSQNPSCLNYVEPAGPEERRGEEGGSRWLSQPLHAPFISLSLSLSLSLSFSILQF